MGMRLPRALAALATASVIAIAAACASSDPDTSGLSSMAQDGQRLYSNRGCAGCHGSDGTGGIGPALVGIAGTERQLIDGRTVVADEEYLIRSITHPNDDIVEGYRVRMPENDLGPTDVAALVAYIQELESTP